MSKNFIPNIAVIGAAGNVGQYITKELVATGKHTVTAITRKDSRTKLPDGVKVAKVDYDDKSSIVEALKGQDALIITLSVRAPKGTQAKFIEAAAEAGVAWIMPNEYSPDFGGNEQFGRDGLLGPGIVEAREHIEKLGVSSWVGLVCSFWYPHVLGHALHPYGFDIPNKKVTFFDDGDTKVTQSTLEQCGRAVAGLFSLPIDGRDACLSQWKNKPCYISSFTMSQKDMLNAICAVTGDTESEWTIEYESSAERYKRAQESLQKGEQAGFTHCMATRVFFKDGFGDYSNKLEDKKVGIAQEDVNKVTKEAFELAQKGYTYS